MSVKKILIMTAMVASSVAATLPGAAVLQSQINTKSSSFHKNEPGKIFPGTFVALSADVKNSGDTPSQKGTIAIRYAFPKPLDNHKKSVIFTTETKELDAIAPGESVTVTFGTTHQWPTLQDFIRHDWPMREYEAVVTIDDTSMIIGTRIISFSAYYYDGPAYEKPATVPTGDE